MARDVDTIPLDPESRQMTPRTRWTIRDVARAAGVSTQTVSRVLNDRPDVAPETFERIRQIIEDTGYRPNMLARGLTQGRSHVLGVVAFGLEYFGPSRVLTGIEQQAAEMGYSISLNLIHEPETDDVDAVLESLFGRQVDGILWAIPEVGNNRSWSRSKSPNFPVPVLLVGGVAEEGPMPSIGIDNGAIGRLATDHLIAGGARRIGIVTGPLGWWESRQRRRGWRESMEASGLSAPDSLVVEGDWSPNSGEEGLNRLLAQRPDIDAVFASNDQMALGVLHALHQLGRSVPDDIAVVGVDNIAESSHFWPSLTTVHQPLHDAGGLAVRHIHQTITARRSRRTPDAPPGQSVLLKPELILRDSSRSVAAGAEPARPGPLV
jgi:LacI family transcriptional regulator